MSRASHRALVDLERLAEFIGGNEYLVPRKRFGGHDVSRAKSLRIPESLLKTIRELARRERLDESTAIRKLIAMGATEYAVQLYREGKITLREAAAMAETTLREMIEILLEHGVKGNVTVSQARKALDYVLAAQDSSNKIIHSD